MSDDQNNPSIGDKPSSYASQSSAPDSVSSNPAKLVDNGTKDSNFFLSASISTLHVTNLRRSITESALREIFEEFLISSLSITDAPYKDRRCCTNFATITFVSPSVAQRAFNQLHMVKHPINTSRALRLLPAFMTSPEDIDPMAHVHIQGLHEKINELELWATFSQFGTVIWCDIPVDEDGSSLGHGSVIFEEAETAAVVIDKIHGKMIMGRTVALERFLSLEQEAAKISEREREERRLAKVLLRNIKYEVTRRQLGDLFKESEGVVKFKLCWDAWGKSKGFAFAWFRDIATARRFKRDYDGMVWHGRRLWVKICRPRRRRNNSARRTKHVDK